MYRDKILDWLKSDALPNTLTLQSEALGVLTLEQDLFEDFFREIASSDTLKRVLWQVNPVGDDQFNNLIVKLNAAAKLEDFAELKFLSPTLPTSLHTSIGALQEAIETENIDAVILGLDELKQLNSERFLTLVHALEFNHNISRLDLNHSRLERLDSRELTTLTDLVANPHFVELDFSHSGLGLLDLKHQMMVTSIIQALKRNSALEKLDLSHNTLSRLSQTLQQHLFATLDSLTLKSLHLSDNMVRFHLGMTQEDQAKNLNFVKGVIKHVQKNKALKILDINNNELGYYLSNENLSSRFAESLGRSNIVALNINRNHLGDRKLPQNFLAKLFVELGASNRLQKFDVSRNQLASQPFAMWLPSFCQFLELSTKLEDLKAYGNDLDELLEVEEYVEQRFIDQLVASFEINTSIVALRLEDGRLGSAQLVIDGFINRNIKQTLKFLTQFLPQTSFSNDVGLLIVNYLGVEQVNQFKSSRTPKKDKGVVERSILIEEELQPSEVSPPIRLIDMDSLPKSHVNMQRSHVGQKRMHRQLFVPSATSNAATSSSGHRAPSNPPLLDVPRAFTTSLRQGQGSRFDIHTNDALAPKKTKSPKP